MSWSSGKDSTAALHVAREQLGIEVVGLLVTMNSAVNRVAMHAVRKSLLEAQADRLGLPLHIVEIPSPCPNDLYEEQMTKAMLEATRDGVEAVVFGDLFLEDVRSYREQALERAGMQARFPLWGRRTDLLARDMVADGIRAVITCVDESKLPPSFAGRAFDNALLSDLPPDVDPCGERGEFHTFVWDGPDFASPIDVRIGDLVRSDGFVFCDVLPAGD